MFSAVDQLLAQDVSSQLLSYLTTLSKVSPLPTQGPWRLGSHSAVMRALPSQPLFQPLLFQPSPCFPTLPPLSYEVHWIWMQVLLSHRVTELLVSVDEGAFKSPSAPHPCDCTLDPTHKVWSSLLTWANCIKPYIIPGLMNIFTNVEAKFFLLLDW